MATLPYTQRGLQQRRTQALLEAVYTDFTNWYMRRRPDWNRIGPRLPQWFRSRLRRVDRRLCLQYIPPRSKEHPDGINCGWPDGAWFICARIPRTRWIARRAVFVLVSKDGSMLPPDRELIRVLQHARRLRRRCKLDELDDQYQQQLDQVATERHAATRNQLIGEMVQTMRKRNWTSRYQPQVFFPAGVSAN